MRIVKNKNKEKEKEEKGASNVGDGHRRRRWWTSWEELEDRADGQGGVARARSTK